MVDISLIFKNNIQQTKICSHLLFYDSWNKHHASHIRRTITPRNHAFRSWRPGSVRKIWSQNQDRNPNFTPPQVAGFTFLEKGMLTKAYFPKKVRDWSSTTTKHSVAVLTGCPSSHTAFSIDDTDLGGDNTYLVDTPKCHEAVKHISVTKFLKDNKKELPTLPS